MCQEEATNTTTSIRLNAVDGKDKTTNHILNKKRHIVHLELNVLLEKITRPNTKELKPTFNMKEVDT